MKNSFWVLLFSTFSIAFFHALAPDHWMPFAAIGRAQKWSKLKLLWITFISGLGHVGISILFSVIGIALGFSLSKIKALEGNRGQVAIWLLIGFGIAYMLWGIKKAGHDRHEHPDEETLRKNTVAVWTLFAVIVLGPCEPLIPLAFLRLQLRLVRRNHGKSCFLDYDYHHDAGAEFVGLSGRAVN